MAKPKNERRPEVLRKVENARMNLRMAISLSPYSETSAAVEGGMSNNVLGKFCRGETDITLTNLLSACEVLNVPISLIVSDQAISPARIRLAKLIDSVDAKDLEAFIAAEKGRV
ncbi:helix-turn-helix domain-containing protein [Leisingera daeponensis]|uniref:Helix-turn-helix domain-containing protein n=1 Tax=Leisingera daeponensis TaxID=405746 RepID=A0ABS7NIW0_9RHOB|nr:helix-turn-helix transcriptional regulator [Leisingera daeponensis]MBY6141143.1 helix-turn-helix domain-containing protein [Leisingera daeponensis]